MKRQPKTGKDEHCEHCPAFMSGMGAMVRVNGFSVVPGRLAAQVTDGEWNAVVTTLGRGTFLIRRREGVPGSACPLRAFEIRHIAKESPTAQKRLRGFGGAPGPERNMPGRAGAGSYGTDG